MQLQTERLLLREFTWDDFEAVYAYESDPLVVRYVCYGPYTEAECRRDLSFHIEQQRVQQRSYYHLAAVLRRMNQVIGWCGLKVLGQARSEAELGYALHPNYWGQGLMTEAAEALVGFGFKALRLHRVFATCHPDNRGSIRVMEKVGMRYERCLRKNKWCRDHWRDTVIYALLDEEWGE